MNLFHNEDFFHLVFSLGLRVIHGVPEALLFDICLQQTDGSLLLGFRSLLLFARIWVHPITYPMTPQRKREGNRVNKNRVTLDFSLRSLEGMQGHTGNKEKQMKTDTQHPFRSMK